MIIGTEFETNVSDSNNIFIFVVSNIWTEKNPQDGVKYWNYKIKCIHSNLDKYNNL